MSIPASQPLAPEVDLARDDDSYLLFYMADASSNPALAEAAFEVFVGRHWEILVGFCRKQRFETFRDTGEAFVTATFLKAFKHAGSFKPPSNGNEEAIRRKAQNWLFTILERLFLDARRKLLREIRARKLKYGDEKVAEPFEQPAIYTDCENVPYETKRQTISARRRTLMLQFMEELSERDRAILIQTQDYIDPNTGKTEPPPEEMEALAVQFGMPEDHIRIYRKRLLDRLRIFIEEAESSSS